ncbi:MAG TPA: hypothetical protein VMU48_10255 [Terracidiphilus sp.]|nr:hypothetical protein [Terracidiphilus sp.]
MSLLSGAEFLLWSSLAFVFWRKGLQRRFPAMGTYLGLRVGSMPILLLLLFGNTFFASQLWLIAYFFLFWAVYIASAITLFFICIEIFRSVLSSFAGLMRLGVMAFRWATLVSAIVGLVTISWSHRGVLVLPDIAYALMRSVSILELCLLAFLCLTMNAFRLSARELTFGITLGFGIMAANDFVQASLISRFASLIAPEQYIYESAILFTLGMWLTYCLLPERARKPVVMPANSTIYRWNEIAAALGHGTQVAVQQPANSFFLSDVEKVVDKVLNRNLQNSESKS